MNTARCTHQTVSGSTVPVQWSLRWAHVKWSRFSNVRLNYSQLCHFNWLSILIFLVFLFNSRTWQVSVGPARNKAPWRGYQRQSGGGFSLQLRPLRALLAQSDAQALALCQQIEADLAGSASPLRAAFQEVSRAVNEFEFDKALQLLAPLLG